MKFLILLISIFSIGCAEERGGGDSNPYTALFRLWTEPNSGHQFDIRGGHFGQNPVVIPVGAKACHCKIAVHGFIDQGTLEIRTCALDGISSDPDCDALNVERTYELGNNSLKVCPKDGSPCGIYY